MHIGGEAAKQLRIIGQGQAGGLSPAAKAHQNMRFKPHVTFKVVGHRGAFDPQKFLGHGFGNASHGLHRWFKLAQKHRAIDGKMIVMDAIPRIKIIRPGAFKVFQINLNRALVPAHHVFVMATQNINMRRHVDKMPRIRHQSAQDITRLQRLFRGGRHLHQVHIKMQQSGVGLCARVIVQRILQQLLAFQRISPLRRGARGQIPHFPRRAV